MKIIVLGAGLIGVTTAYLLQMSGHKVTIIDKQPGPGEKSSYSNGAQLSYCHAEPWSSFDTLMKALKWIGKKDKPLLWKPSADPMMWEWIIRFLTKCNSASVKIGTEKILKLGLYSRDVLKDISKDLEFDFDHQKLGKIFIIKTEKEYNEHLKQARKQELLGSRYEILNRDEMIKAEPSLKHIAHKIYGCFRDPLDESGDAYKFCVGMDRQLEKLGVKRIYNEEIKEIEKQGNEVSRIITDKNIYTADCYIMCLGAYSPLISKQLNLKLPIYPLKGYSITLPIKNPEEAPKTSITDVTSKVVFTNLGGRLRVAGTAEFAGYNEDITDYRIKMMQELVKENFPMYGDVSEVVPYACLRPSTPDGVPILGKCKVDNLLLNTGHGTLGWTQTFASAKIISDMVNGDKPELPLEWYSIERF